MKLLTLLTLIISISSFGQSYNSYFLGNVSDVVTSPKGGVCLMGGATEHDEAMKWFLQQADGGDVLVLRATGSNGYNDYMLNQLGVTINSVETIVCNNANASQDAYLQQKINQAEAIWFAGGDQWTYISYWRNTPVDSLVNKAIAERNIVVGGTSAGMAIMGNYYFSAQNGTVTSGQALANPYNSLMTISNEPFIVNQHLSNVITDTHYDSPDRKGRHVTFLSRILQDYQAIGKGIACDEYTAVCIDTIGFCKIYGDYPTYDEDVYFIQPNCELSDVTPETCIASTPLTWNKGGQALKVYHAKGTPFGTQTFDLNDWTSGTGGVWEYWYVENGVLTQTAGTAPDCGLASLSNMDEMLISVYPNPVIGNAITIEGLTDFNWIITDLQGKEYSTISDGNQIDVSKLTNGVYLIRIETELGNTIVKRIVKN
jgi:cyanophycinase-like exopeptidase